MHRVPWRFENVLLSMTYRFIRGFTVTWLMTRRTPDIPLTAAVAALI
jgi:hypothetical protein